MASGGGSIESGEPEFQIAPMIDVLLVLLIFFISITSMEVLRIDQDIVLPVAEDAVKAQKERGEVILNVRYDEENRKARYNINSDSRPIETTELLVAELTKAVSIATVIRLRVFKSSPGRCHTSPQPLRVTYSWMGAVNGVKPVKARATKSSPITRLRVARPASKSLLGVGCDGFMGCVPCKTTA